MTTSAAASGSDYLQVAESIGPEVFLGIVGPIGTDLDLLCGLLCEVLDNEVAYKCDTIRLIDLVRELDQWKDLPSRPIQTYYERAMTAGDEFREQLGRGDALALLAIRFLRDQIRGKGRNSQHPLHRQAYLFRSLKHPQEVETLRRSYGDAFCLIGAYAPRANRIETLARKLSGSTSTSPSQVHRHAAEQLIDRDEDESGVKYGQAVRDTFPLADFFVDVSRPHEEIKGAIARWVRLIFGHPYITPTREEHGMFHAQAAALRSSAMGRQVGASICSAEGDLLALGTNEVPKAFGGQYWGDEATDARDFQLGIDSNDEIKRQNLAELLSRLRKAQWLADHIASQDIDEVVRLAGLVLKGARVMSPIEYGRSVHAEMSAIVDAAKRGVGIRGATLFATTFPCHECARHIISAGVISVYYIEPYPKSLAKDLHNDSISVEEDGRGVKVSFQPFVGVAPRQYLRLFSMKLRKDHEGRKLVWQGRTALPVSPGPFRSYFHTEDWLGEELIAAMQDRQLALSF